MSEHDAASETRRAVRVELLDDDISASPSAEMPSTSRSHSPWPILAMGLALLALLGGLRLAAGLSENDRDSREENGRAQEVGPDQVERGLSRDVEAESDTIPPEDEVPQSTGELFISLSEDLQQFARGPRGLLASGTLDDELTNEFSPIPIIARTSDGRAWVSRPMENVAVGSRIVGLIEQIEAPENERVVVFTVGSPGGPSSELVIHTSRGGSDDPWDERNRFAIDGHVRTLSSRDGRWVAIVDERAQASSSVPPMRTRLATGLIDGETTEVLSVAPDEFVSSYAAFDGGLLAVVIRLQLSGLEEDAPAPELRNWTPDDGWEVLIEDLTLPTGAPPRLVDAGDRGVFLTSGAELRSFLDFDSGETEVSLSTQSIFDLVDEGLEPELTPATIDPGFLVVDNVVGDTSQLWTSIDGNTWRRHVLTRPMRDLTLLRIDNGIALLSGIRDGERGVLRLEVTGPLPLEFRQRTLVDGEWSTPVYTTDRIGDSGFVGLSNKTGQIDLVESADGVSIDAATQTDFPFGYFVNEMEISPAGYHVVGQLGLLEDAVFTSSDGVAWDRMMMDLPDGATALEIDHFHRTDIAASMAGSLGWADDLSRIERVILWWNADGEQVRVPARPCLDDNWVCTVTSLVAVGDGLLATHSRDQDTGVSKWTEATGWAPIEAFEPSELESAVFTSTTSTSVWLLGTGQISRSDDGGRTWETVAQAPPGEHGRFLGVSASGASAVFQADDALWFRSGSEWVAFALGDVQVRQLLAITESSALLTGASSVGTGVIRLAPPGPG